MELIRKYIERRLWPSAGLDQSPPQQLLLAARFAYALLRDFLDGELSLRAMSLVYTTMLAVVPLLAFSFSVLKGLGFHRTLAPLLERVLEPLGPRAGEITQRVIGFIDNVSGSTLASIAILLLLYTALSMAHKVESSFNFVWRVDRSRSLARRFSEYLSVIFVGPLVLSIALGFTATVASTAAASRLKEIQPIGGWLVSSSAFLPYLLVFAAFSFLYVFVPNTRVRLKPALIGALFAGVLWAAGGRMFATFVVTTSRTLAIYASFAIVIFAMLWLYWSWLILLFGAQLAFYVQNPDSLRIGHRREPVSNALRERLALGSMLLVTREFAADGVRWTIETLAADMRVPRHLLEPVIASLVGAELLTLTADQRLTPARDPRAIRVLDVLAVVRGAEHEIAGAASATVRALEQRIARAVDGAAGSESLADLAFEEAPGDGAAPHVSTEAGPRIVSRR